MNLPPIQIDDPEFLENHFDLPPLPALATTLLGRLRAGDIAAAEVSELLASDPGLVAQILKIVNSAYFGLPRRIAEVRHAVAYLGLSEIERLVLTATVMKNLTPQDVTAFERFWSHSFYAALISKHVATRYARGVDTEELRTAVLLHDIGKLVYMQFFPDHFREMTAYCDAERCPLTEAEGHFGYPPHARLGAILADRWKLPEIVQRGCEHHELADLGNCGDAAELRVICLANLLSNLAAGSLSGEHKEAIQQATIESLDCSEQDFLLLMGEIYDLRSGVEQFLRQL